MEEVALDVQGISKTYKDGTVALRNVNLTIRKGEIFGLLGPNGAGKSTLINILTTLTTKTQGTIRIAGVDFDTAQSEAKTYLGVVPQEFNFGIFEKIQDIVVQQAGYYGVPRDVATERAVHYLTKLGLGDKLQATAMQLSGGMKRRLMIARALVHEPDILILDEPSAGVDVELRREMWEFIQEIHQQGKTIILTTHYLEEAEQLCDRIGIIHQGTVLQVGTVTDLLSELQRDRLILDVEGTPIQALPDRYQVISDEQLETDLLKGEDLWDITTEMHNLGLKVTGIRNKTNRLEEVFLSKVQQ